jgi:hypothetical protein
VSGGPAARRLAGGREVCGPDGRTALTLGPNEFETRFFRRRTGVLEMDAAAPAALPPQDRRRATALVDAVADGEGYSLM